MINFSSITIHWYVCIRKNNCRLWLIVPCHVTCGVCCCDPKVELCLSRGVAVSPWKICALEHLLWAAFCNIDNSGSEAKKCVMCLGPYIRLCLFPTHHTLWKYKDQAHCWSDKDVSLKHFITQWIILLQLFQVLLFKLQSGVDEA